jgi:N-acetyl sugar amidotransferase
MEYCKRCLYPANAKPTIILDDEGVCSGCRYHESRQKIDWNDRQMMLKQILKEHKEKASAANNPYDCIIPVSGGKDSHFQVYLMKVVYGMNPLLVTYNHIYNTSLGIRNLNNLVEKLGVDLIRFTASPESVRKISRYMLKTVGDLTWHYHAGIRTLPFQIAVKYKIPLIVWGEHGFAELTGIVTLEDMVEFTKWTRQEHDMRGYEPHDLINTESGITEKDIVPYVYPEDEEIEKLDLRGIYLSNFYYWDALGHAKKMREMFDFGIHPGPREKTFILHGKIDDHANDVHDYLKFLKFGYGRATDDTSMEVRHGRMTREEGIELVKKYDHVCPSSLDTYLEFLQVTEQEFYDWIEPMRDPDIWEKGSDGQWSLKDSVANHANDTGVEKVRPELKAPADRTFGENNQNFYWKEEMASKKTDRQIQRQNADDEKFIIL